MAPKITIQGLTKHFGQFVAVDGVTFQVGQGEVLGFLGPNGAGKSTTMKMVTGFLHPTSGTATVCGHDILQNPIEAKRNIGYLPEGAPLYPDMTPATFLGFVAEVRRIPKSERARRIAEVVGRVQLASVMHQPIETLSKGFKRRVGLAQAILHDPPVLVLDEPTDGLDPNQKHEVRNLIRDMAKDKAIVLSTHILEEVEAVCSRVIIIAAGKLVIDCSPAELAAKSRFHNAVTVIAHAKDADKVRLGLESLECVAKVEETVRHNGTVGYRCLSVGGRAIVADVGARVREARWEVDEVRSETGRLDDVFRDLTQPAGASRN
jgi:ABC-2 type transport system ATP-binding protein